MPCTMPHLAILHIQLGAHLAVSTACLAIVTGLYVRTLVAWGKRYGPRPPTQGRTPRGKSSKALWRLVAILGCFIVTWGIVLGNDIAALVAQRRSGGGSSGGSVVGDVPSTFMVLVDAVVLGNVLALCRRRWCRCRQTAAAAAAAATATGASAEDGRARRSSDDVVSRRSCAGLLLRPQGHPGGDSGSGGRRLRIFASTFNVGGSGSGSAGAAATAGPKGVAALGPVEAWIPPGFDLYVIVSRP